MNQEDLTKEPHQQNLPGTTWQYPNWSRKMRFTVEELRTDKDRAGFHGDVPQLGGAHVPRDPLTAISRRQTPGAHSARGCPSTEPENTMPSIAVTAADCAGLHGRRSPHPGLGVCQMRSIRSAIMTT